MQSDDKFQFLKTSKILTDFKFFPHFVQRYCASKIAFQFWDKGGRGEGKGGGGRLSGTLDETDQNPI